MTRTLFAERFGMDLDAGNRAVVFVGDSPNDAPMFGFFPNAVGVANVAGFADRMAHLPRWITPSRSGAGFAEMAQALLSARQDA
jgi:hydroxymethylpyrimidine pyrophosphatase-like HAD family hydrolase